jgi:hypothetical protein
MAGGLGWGGEDGSLRLRLGISTETLTSQDLAVNSSNSGGKQQQQFQANRIVKKRGVSGPGLTVLVDDTHYKFSKDLLDKNLFS